MHFYKFNIGDYASHTRHLSPLEDIAYRRLLDVAYSSELPLTKDIRQLSRLINMRENQQEIEDVLKEFWVEIEEGWISNRVLKEIEATGGKSEKAKESAKMRWDNVRKAKAMREESEGNANAQEKHANASENDATQDPRQQDPLPTTQDPIPKTQTKSKDLPPPPALPEKKATRLPKDWVLPKTWGDWALAEYPLCTAGDVREMADSFKDHWIANASRATGKKDDWLATWRNWVRKNHPNKAGVPRQAGTSYHEKLTDTAEQIFGRKHGTGNQIIDITPKQAAGSDSENIPAVYAGLRA